jgi:OmpA-OmpF porin, OOP family
MQKFLWGAALAAVLLPSVAQAQAFNPQPGFYLGACGGIVGTIGSPNSSTGPGWLAGGKAGYDFVGPRI